jgi:hypothetical protein
MACLRDEKKSKCILEPNQWVSKLAGLYAGPACAAEEDVSNLGCNVAGTKLEACTVPGTLVYQPTESPPSASKILMNCSLQTHAHL